MTSSALTVRALRGKVHVDFSAAPSIQDKTNLFIRLLYNRGVAAEAEQRLADGALSPEWQSFLETVDFDAVRVEQVVRVSDMRAHLVRTTPGLLASLGEARFDDLVRDFCEAPMLWEPRGRTLTEHFCCFAEAALREDDAFAAAAARLDGVISGTETAAHRETPWSGHRKPSPERELFVVRHALFDDQMRPPSAENVAELRRAPLAPRLVVVEGSPEGGVCIQCIALPSGGAKESIQ